MTVEVTDLRNVDVFAKPVDDRELGSETIDGFGEDADVVEVGNATSEPGVQNGGVGQETARNPADHRTVIVGYLPPVG